jgi:hypothetical protein
MADVSWAAFSEEDAALFLCAGTQGAAMVEILFMAQLVRNPLQAMARRWWCKSLYRATRGERRCPECTAS